MAQDLWRWRPNQRFARQDFDDYHGCPAIRADEGRRGCCFQRVRLGLRGFRHHLQQFPGSGQMVSPPAIGQQATWRMR